jgi:hypothetical protein
MGLSKAKGIESPIERAKFIRAFTNEHRLAMEAKVKGARRRVPASPAASASKK